MVSLVRLWSFLLEILTSSDATEDRRLAFIAGVRTREPPKGREKKMAFVIRPLTLVLALALALPLVFYELIVLPLIAWTSKIQALSKGDHFDRIMHKPMVDIETPPAP